MPARRRQWLYLYLENEGGFNALRQMCSRIWEVSVFFLPFEYLYTVHYWIVQLLPYLISAIYPLIFVRRNILKNTLFGLFTNEYTCKQK